MTPTTRDFFTGRSGDLESCEPRIWGFEPSHCARSLPSHRSILSVSQLKKTRTTPDLPISLSSLARNHGSDESTVESCEVVS
jgi:hypothetical protein